jgi:predicted RNA binding protein YcfA (HicA-like mRNA interferase family)
MAVLPAKKSYQHLKSKGFQEASNKSVDHKWLEFWYDGKLTRIKTKMSHGAKEIDDGLISLMARQTYLSSNQFIKMAECTISEKEYIELLKQKNIIK